MDKIKYFLFIALLGFISACQGTTLGDKLRITSEGPDEFSVAPSSPLTIPHDFTLPTPTASSTVQGENTDEEEFKPKTREHLKAHPSASEGENVLLDKFATENPNLKKIINQNIVVAKEPLKKGFFSKFNFFARKKNQMAKDATIDPEADKEKRIYTSKSVNVIRTQGDMNKDKRICDVKDGKAKYCEEFKIMKNFPLVVETNNK